MAERPWSGHAANNRDGKLCGYSARADRIVPGKTHPFQTSGRSVSGDSVVPSQSEGPGFIVPVPQGAWTLPPDCPCCGALAVREVRLSDGRGRYLLLGYCDVCAAHIARAATRRLSAALASLLLGVSAAAGLPIVLPFASVLTCVVLSSAAALLPLLVQLLRVRPRPGHAAVGPSVRFHEPDALICQSEAFAERVAQHLGVSRAAVTKQARRLPTELLLGAVPALLALAFFAFHHPFLRVMNLGDVPLELWVDGRRIGRVEASSGESPTSGLEVRVPSGKRSVSMRNPENLEVARSEVVLQAGRHHLYVPVTGRACFWLETTGYGREQRRPSLRPLPGEGPFFLVPDDVEGWFVPSAPGDETARATGGTSTVLRQAPCTAPFDPK